MKKVVKKPVKKYNNGGNTGTSKTRTVTKDPEGNYKTITKSKSGPSGFSNSINTRRTIKGVISGAPKPGQEPLDSINSPNLKNRENQNSNFRDPMSTGTMSRGYTARVEAAAREQAKKELFEARRKDGYGMPPKSGMPKQKKGGSVKRKK